MNKRKSLKDNLYVSLFWEFFKLGLFTIGGGMAMLPLIQDIVVEKKGWMSEEEAVDCIAVGQSLPGVIAINMATYIGRQKKGLPGAVCATAGVILPSFLIIILIVEVLEGLGDSRWISGALTGIKAAATGLIGYSAYKIGKKTLNGTLAWILAIGAFTAVAWLEISAVFVIAAGILIGILSQKAVPAKRDGGDGK
ncbi:MAG: chromate transporter [Firmicutes bacterium]|nr:chromate transporter [Bacillota bacterium]